MRNIQEMTLAFEAVYREARWGNGSGPGSHPSNTITYRAYVQEFMRSHHVRTVTDLGCGDWQFSHLLDWSSVQYVGLDVVRSILAANEARHAGVNVRFRPFTSTQDLPGGDLLLCKEVLQHLPNSDVSELLDTFLDKYKYSLVTNTVDKAEMCNRDVTYGDWRPLCLGRTSFGAHGEVVLTYFPQSQGKVWQNETWLLRGRAR